MSAQTENYTKRATGYFKKALALKPGGWVAMEGLARCYGENLRKYETAIEWMENSILNLPQTEDFKRGDVGFYLETRIADSKLRLGDNVSQC